MSQLLLLTKLSVILLLVPADECRQIGDSSDYEESQLLDDLLNVHPIKSKLLPFIKNQQALNSLHSPLISSSSYEIGKPSANSILSESLQPSIYPKGQESSWYIKEYNLKKNALLPTLGSNHLKPSIYSRGQELSRYLTEPHSNKPPVSPLLESDLSEEVPQFSNSVVHLDESLELSDTVPFSGAKLTLCQLNKLLKGTQSSAEDCNDQKFHAVILQPTSYEEDQPLASRARSREIKLLDQSSQLASDWFGSKRTQESLVKKNRRAVKKLKLFENSEQEMKFKQKSKDLLIHKGKKQKINKKVKIGAKDEPLKKKWKKIARNVSSRKSKTQRCFKTRKQDDKGSRTVCVTYPASWGEGASYYPYYYPYYYYPTYYPYYFYGRR